jgi:hypothetical protein
VLQGAIRRSSSVRLRTPPAPSPLGPAALGAAATPQQARASGTGAAGGDRLHPVFGWQASSGGCPFVHCRSAGFMHSAAAWLAGSTGLEQCLLACSPACV